MQLHDLQAPYGANRKRKRVGRGAGSGNEKTSGRGTKGQKARAGGNIPPWFEGGQNKIVKALPYKRGFHNRFATEYNTINIGRLAEVFADSGEEITPELLLAYRLISHPDLPTKIMGNGELGAKLNISAHAFTTSAMQKIQAAGGVATELEHPGTVKRRERHALQEAIANTPEGENPTTYKPRTGSGRKNRARLA
jgi:large subunit ribosomal protein L15